MAKGKQAAMAANRRLSAAQDHIDRLTNLLVEAKIRARTVEAAAAQVPRLREEIRSLREERESDELVAKLSERVAYWDAVRRRDRDRRMAALNEIRDVMITDIQALKGMGGSDAVEFFFRRYPRTLSALCGDVEDEGSRQNVYASYVSTHGAGARRLSEASMKRLQVSRGLRGMTDAGRDQADVLSEVLDGRQAGFSFDEIRELLEPDLPS